MNFHSLKALRNLNWALIYSILALGLIGVAVLYSVADSDFALWSLQHSARLGFGMILMFTIALMDVRLLYASAYVLFIVLLIMLIGVEVGGTRSMGAQRWLDLGFLRVQPSEFMRIGLILALARYYQTRHPLDVSKLQNLIMPAIFIITPAVLIFRQPDLGTSIMLVLTGLGVLYLAGVNWRYFAVGGVSIAAAIPFIWQTLLPYQKQRVLVFLNPEQDPLGSGYHIIQSKIGIGSGGLSGKGFGEGTQSRLNFLPEKHTDFIFTIFAEEMGFIGGIALLLLFVLVIFLHFNIIARLRNPFSRLCVGGMGWALFVYVFVNLAMVMGLLPVVGVPLPFISYGGTSLLTFLLGIGVVLCVERQSMTELPRS
ncbi:MAG: rod shape-determining protein RodA [Alphaproteobacteria bacterium]|nr:rod shape-determining protein RodA [Alphaproteobacteria bacterium]MBE8220201.1 rod shape-determining protein RodA [Alphaproteobacteria bacterium]